MESACAGDHASEPTITGPFYQLRLALLAGVERMRSAPPERGLLREALARAAVTPVTVVED